MDATTYTLVLQDGTRFGPVDGAQLEQWAREGRVPRTASLLPADGGPPVPVGRVPALAEILSIEPAVEPPSGGGTSAVIPYKNPPALIAYYLGLFSLFPMLGLLLAVPALVLGIVGLRRHRRDPRIHGVAHAWIGIVMGACMTVLWGGCGVVMLVSAASGW